MIRIFKQCLVAVLFTVMAGHGTANGSDGSHRLSTDRYQVIGVKITGASRTDPDWVEEYLGYDWPAIITEKGVIKKPDTEKIRRLYR